MGSGVDYVSVLSSRRRRAQGSRMQSLRTVVVREDRPLVSHLFTCAVSTSQKSAEVSIPSSRASAVRYSSGQPEQPTKRTHLMQMSVVQDKANQPLDIVCA